MGYKGLLQVTRGCCRLLGVARCCKGLLGVARGFWGLKGFYQGYKPDNCRTHISHGRVTINFSSAVFGGLILSLSNNFCSFSISYFSKPHHLQYFYYLIKSKDKSFIFSCNQIHEWKVGKIIFSDKILKNRKLKTQLMIIQNDKV